MKALDQLEELIKNNWPEHGVIPDDATIAQARRFIGMMPTHLPQPEIAGDNDGTIGFDWYARRHASVVASIWGNGNISYAVSADGTKFHGVLALGDTFPSLFTYWVRRIFTEKLDE